MNSSRATKVPLPRNARWNRGATGPAVPARRSQTCRRPVQSPAPNPAKSSAKVAVMKSPRTPTTRVWNSSVRLGTSCAHASRSKKSRSALCITTNRIHQKSRVLRMENRGRVSGSFIQTAPADRHVPVHRPSGRGSTIASPSHGLAGPPPLAGQDRRATAQFDRPRPRHRAAAR